MTVNPQLSFPKKILLFIIILGLIFLSLELLTRLLSPKRSTSQLRSLLQATPDERKYILKPNHTILFDGLHIVLETPVIWKINNEGFKSDKSINPKTHGSIRVATFGDSEVFGWSVDFEDTFQEQIEKLDAKFEVLNFGVPGYNIHQIAKHIEITNTMSNPDIILYIINPNDFDLPIVYNESLANSIIVKSQLLRKLFIAFELVKGWIDEKRRRSPKVVDRFINGLIDIKQFCENNDIYLVIAFINSEDEFVLYENEELGNYFLEADSFSHHILDISPAIENCEKIDIHFNKECHKELSIILENHLQKLVL